MDELKKYLTLLPDDKNVVINDKKQEIYKEIEYVYIDCNGFIYDYSFNAMKHKPLSTIEECIISHFINELENNIINKNKFPKCELFYIAIDGLAPLAKIRDQRIRRYTNYIKDTKKEGDETTISAPSFHIYPGTAFMKKVENILKKWIKLKNKEFNIEISDSNEEGESKHKLFCKLRNQNNAEQKHLIYSHDRDLLFLGLLHLKGFNSIYWEISNDNLLIFINNYFYNVIYVKVQDTDKKHRLCKHFVQICFLFGNDFLPKLPEVELVQNNENSNIIGIDKLLEIYDENNFITKAKFDLISFLKKVVNKKKIKNQNESNIKNKDYTSVYDNYVKDKKSKKAMVNKYYEMFNWTYNYYKDSFNINANNYYPLYNLIPPLEYLVQFHNNNPVPTTSSSHILKDNPEIQKFLILDLPSLITHEIKNIFDYKSFFEKYKNYYKFPLYWEKSTWNDLNNEELQIFIKDLNEIQQIKQTTVTKKKFLFLYSAFKGRGKLDICFHFLQRYINTGKSCYFLDLDIKNNNLFHLKKNFITYVHIKNQDDLDKILHFKTESFVVNEIKERFINISNFKYSINEYIYACMEFLEELSNIDNDDLVIVNTLDDIRMPHFNFPNSSKLFIDNYYL